MNQQLTFDAHFDGADYNPELDKERLKKQIGRVYDVMDRYEWLTLAEIQDKIELLFHIQDPEASISAQLRHLRKAKFGSHKIERRRRTTGTWEYRLNHDLTH